jgi:hypothetical protein
MNNLKAGDKVAIKATGIEGTITNVFLNGKIKLVDKEGNRIYKNKFADYFYSEELGYTNDQKEHMQFEADQHTQIIQAQNEYHYYNR